jgi:hypothetical protein
VCKGYGGEGPKAKLFCTFCEKWRHDKEHCYKLRATKEGKSSDNSAVT